METTQEPRIDALFEAGAQYGYSKSRRHPSFSDYVFTTKDGNDVINLEKTAELLDATCAAVASAASEGKMFLFVGTKPEVRKIVEEAALSVDAPYIVNRWIGGLLTNFGEIKKRTKRLEELTGKKERGELSVYTKKEQLLIDQEIRELLSNFGGVAGMSRLPDMMIVVDPRNEHIALAEAAKKSIPVVAIAGSDCNIRGLRHVVPANDSSVSSVSLFFKKMTEAITAGTRRRAAAKEAPATEAAAPSSETL